MGEDEDVDALRRSEGKPAVNGITARSPIHVLMKFFFVLFCVVYLFFGEHGSRGFSSPFHLVHYSGSSNFRSTFGYRL